MCQITPQPGIRPPGGSSVRYCSSRSMSGTKASTNGTNAVFSTTSSPLEFWPVTTGLGQTNLEQGLGGGVDHIHHFADHLAGGQSQTVALD